MQKKGSFQKTKKYQPNGLTILFEDRDIIVVDKVNGLLTVGNAREKQKTAHYILNDYVRKGNHRSKSRVFVVHRIDRDTSGILIFAKNEKVKRYLQGEWANFTKIYMAIVRGQLQVKEGVITSHLLENKAYKVYSVRNPSKGKLAKTGYKVVKESASLSLLEIVLHTGRKHQIRVHFFEKGHVVVGDKLYDEKEKGAKRLALHASSLTILHPYSKKEMTFETAIPPYFKTIMKG